MASTTDFHNIIRYVLRSNSVFSPTNSWFKFKVEDDANWYPTNGYISCNCVAVGGLLRFTYTWTSGLTRYYLPTTGVNTKQIDKINIYNRYGGMSSYQESDLGFQGSDYVLLHTADIDDQVEYDENDYIKTIGVDLNIATQNSTVNSQLAKRLTGNAIAPKLNPGYMKFGDDSFGTDGSGSFVTDFYSQSESGTNIVSQNTSFPSNFSIEVYGVIDSTIEPTKYRLYNEDQDIILDEGNISEDSSTANITWTSGDTVKFTYTNTALNKE